MHKLLVTGGAGFIGSHLVEALVEGGNEVVVIDDLSLGNLDNLKNAKDKITFYEVSVADDLREIFSKHKFEAVFHIAALPRVQYSIQHPVETHKANVEGTLNLLEQCRLNGVKRFVFSSSASIYGNQEDLPLREKMGPSPLSPYALHKLIGEQYCALYHALYGIESVSLRYFNVYGARQSPSGEYACLIPKFAKIMREGKNPIIYGDGSHTRDFVHVKDVVSANIAAWKAGSRAFGRTFNVGSGVGLSVNDVFNKLKHNLGYAGNAHYGPEVIEPRHALADISLAREFLGWSPKIGFEEGLKLALG